MTIKVPFTRAPRRRPSPAAVLLLSRPSVTPLSRTAFLRQRELLCEAFATHGLYSCPAQAAETTAPK
jgi:hypothetical protein